jgi:hypothetical protein
MSNGLPCHDTVCLDVVVIATGIDDGKSNNITISPNPARDKIMIRSSEEVTEIKIFNSQGEEIPEASIKGNTAYLPANITPGLYFLQIVTTKGIAVRKLVVE